MIPPLSKQRRLIAPAVLLLSASLAGCGTVAASTPQTQASPVTGGTLKYGLDYVPECLDPQLVLGSVPDLWIVDTLTVQDPDTGAIKPSLATAWTVSPDATTYTFTLREGVTFSDGGKLDATAVKANFDRILQLGPKAANASAKLAGSTTTVADTANTVTVTFAKPAASFLQSTSTSSLGIESPSTLGAPENDRCQGKFAGSGPFTLSKFTANEGLTLSRRSAFQWPSALAKHSGEAYLDSVEISFLKDAATRVGALTSGQVDLTAGINPQDEARVNSGNFTLQAHNYTGVVLGLILNPGQPILREAAVRQAIQIGVDRTEIQKTLSPSYHVPSSVLSPPTLGYENLAADLAFDPDEASKLLDGAGWKPGPDGIRQKDGQRLKLDAIFGNIRSLALVQSQLKKIGVDLNLKAVAIANLADALKNKQYDFFLRDAGGNDPDVLRTLFLRDAPGTSNLAGVDSSLEQALASLGTTADAETRLKAGRTAQEILIRDGWFIPIQENASTLAASSAVQGAGFGPSFLYDVWKKR